MFYLYSEDEIIRAIEYPTLQPTSSSNESSAGITFNYDERPPLLPQMTLYDTPYVPQLSAEFMYHSAEELEDEKEELDSFLKAM